MGEAQNNWKVGVFYFNPKNPAMLVKKRSGIGYTFNYGNPLSVLLTVGLIALLVYIKLRP